MLKMTKKVFQLTMEIQKVLNLGITLFTTLKKLVKQLTIHSLLSSN